MVQAMKLQQIQVISMLDRRDFDIFSRRTRVYMPAEYDNEK